MDGVSATISWTEGSDINHDFINVITYNLTDRGALSVENISVGNIIGNFIGNGTYSRNTGNYACGAALVNSGGSIKSITGDFIANYASADNYAGATTVSMSYQSLAGGAIYNVSSASIGDIAGDFIGNYLFASVPDYDSSEAYYFSLGGAIYNDSSSAIGTITGNFIANYINSTGTTTLYSYGGAICNYGSIKGLIGDFTDNYSYSVAKSSYGGAIYNGSAATISTIEGSFIKNSAQSQNSYACGGAIYNTGTITNITGDFIENYAYSENSYAYGGAIYNSKSISLIDSSFINNSASSYGGAIYNSGTVTITAESKDILFSGNTASLGSAICNNGGSVTLKASNSKKITINDSIYNNGTLIIGDAANASAYSGTTQLAGATMGGEIQMESGKLYITAHEDDEDADAGTYTYGTLTLNGGTTYLGSTNSLDSSSTLNAQGGNLDVQDGELNDYTVGAVTGSSSTTYSEDISVIYIDVDVVNQTADTFTADSMSGSVSLNITPLDNLRDLTKENITGEIEVFKLSDGSTDSLNDFYIFPDGGYFIYYTCDYALTFYQDTDNRGWIHFELESATHTLSQIVGSVEGYRIYEMLKNESAGDVTMSEYGEMLIRGNGYTITDGGLELKGGNVLTIINANTDANSHIILSGSSQESTVAQLSLDNDGADVLMEGKVSGNSADNAEYNQVSIEGDGSYTISNTMENITLTLAQGTVNYTQDAYLGSADASEASNIINFAGSSVDLRNGQASTINVKDITVTAGTTSQITVDVDLAAAKMDSLIASDDQTTGSTTGSVEVTTLNLLSDALTNVTYVTFTNDADLMKSVLFEDIIGMEGYSATESYLYDVSYLPESGEFVFIRYNQSVNTDLLAPDVAIQGAYLGMMGAYEQIYTNYDMFTAKNQKEREAIEQHRKGYKAWVTPYSTFGSLELTNGLDADEQTWGTFVGVDSPIKDLGKDWRMIYTVYGGYQGSYQSYTGTSIKQNGGMGGLSALFYKKNFWASVVSSIGGTSVDVTTRTYDEHMGLLTAGVACKTGYNFEVQNGDYIIQPNVQLSYSHISGTKFTSDAGVDMVVDSLGVFQIAPGVRFISNKNTTWQPYATAQMVWNMNNASCSTANGEILPDSSIKPYVQYGVGTQYQINEHCSTYGQIMLQSGGRQGVSINLGFSWDFE